MQLLIECARARRDEAAVKSAARRVRDWNALLDRAAIHGLEPMLYWALDQIRPREVPPAVLARLRRRFQIVGLRNTILSRELVGLASRFRQIGLEIVSFKGPALAASLYEDPALRPASDLDLLVRPSHADRAASLLSDCGYKAAYTLDRRFFRSNCELPMCSAETGVTIDLHWALGPACFHHALDLRGLWRRVETVAVDGHPVPTLSRRDCLMFLCLHGAKHSWCSLRWLADVARLVDTAPLDWDAVMAEARARRASRILLTGLLLASDVLGADVPAEIVEPARADERLAGIAVRARSRMAAAPLATAVTWEDLMFQLSVLERGVDKLKFCWGHLDPTPADLAALPLPPSLYLMYYALRPLRLLAKHGAALRRPVSWPSPV